MFIIVIPVATFYNRHVEAANRFRVQNAAGRIFFAPQVTSVEEATEYGSFLFFLGTLAVFNRENPITDQNGFLNGSNLYVILQWPVAGNIQEPRNSCAGR